MATITGTPESETLQGTQFNDSIFGLEGDDILVGGTGNDSLTGGEGSDNVDYSNLDEAITILPQGVFDKGSLGTDSVTPDVETIIGATDQFNAINGSSAVDGGSITVDLAENSLTANDIPDVGSLSFTIENFVDVTGTPDNDKITGDDADNLLDGWSGDDGLLGNDGSDTLLGFDGSDSLDGGDGSDFLSGEAGNDTLTGGADADIFTFFSPFEGIDTITDFDFVEGDKIEVDSIGFDIGQGEFDKFSFDTTTNALFFDDTQFATLQLDSGFVPSLDINIV